MAFRPDAFGNNPPILLSRLVRTQRGLAGITDEIPRETHTKTVKKPARQEAGVRHGRSVKLFATGSLSSGGIHMRHREHCFWEWPLIEAHRSTASSFMNLRSLLFRFCRAESPLARE